MTSSKQWCIEIALPKGCKPTAKLLEEICKRHNQHKPLPQGIRCYRIDWEPATRHSQWGIVKRRHRPAQVMLDIDYKTPRLKPIFSTLRVIGLTALHTCLERTRKGWHVTILLNRELPAFATVALQSILGSDHRREALNLMRLLHHPSGEKAKTGWNLLYMEKLQQ